MHFGTEVNCFDIGFFTTLINFPLIIFQLFQVLLLLSLLLLYYHALILTNTCKVGLPCYLNYSLVFFP